MTGRGLGRVVAFGLVVAAVWAPGLAQQTTCRGRLSMPNAEDQIGFPQGLTTDLRTDEIFVCDARKNRLVIFDKDGLFRYEIHGGGVFSAPVDVAVDPWGFLLVLANHDRHRAIVELDFDGLFLREVRPTGVPEEMIDPGFKSIALSPTGDRIYLLDQANLALWVLERDGRVLSMIDLAADLSERDRRDLILSKVDVYGETVLIAVPSSGQIRLFDLDGNATGIAGNKGTAPCQLGFPTAAALDEEGNLLIVDQQRMYLIHWAPEGNRCLGEFVGAGSVPCYLYYPLDVALDRQGRAYISQGYLGWVQAYGGFTAARSPAGEVSAVAPPRGQVGPVERITDVIRNWSDARSQGWAEAYLATYSDGYRPPGYADLDSWMDDQRRELAGARWIGEEITPPEIEFVRPELVRVRFTRRNPTRADGESRRVVLLLRREDGNWRILEEREDAGP